MVFHNTQFGRSLNNAGIRISLILYLSLETRTLLREQMEVGHELQCAFTEIKLSTLTSALTCKNSTVRS